MLSPEDIAEVVRQLLAALHPAVAAAVAQASKGLGGKNLPTIQKHVVDEHGNAGGMGPHKYAKYGESQDQVRVRFSRLYGEHLDPQQLASAAAADNCLGAAYRGQRLDHATEYARAFSAIGGGESVARYQREQNKSVSEAESDQKRADRASARARAVCLEHGNQDYAGELSKQRQALGLS